MAAAPSPLMSGEATLYRDQWGVPHIWSDSCQAAGYAIGQAQCEDSLYNVVYCLYAGVGRLCELTGPGLLKADLEARQLRHAVFARQAWPELSPQLRDLVTGFCAGVNDYLKSHPDELPVPVGKIEPVQVIAWHRALLMISTASIAKADAEASRADGYHPVNAGGPDPAPGVKSQQQGQPEHPGVRPGKSNSWALSGAKTASGVPLLLIDPHWPASGHLQLYEMWLHIGNDLHVGGFAPSGTPLPGLAATPYAAWTVTAGGADSSDAYALKLNPDNPHQYQFDGKWLDMDVREETIRIRQPDGQFTTRTVQVLATRHGPVLKTRSGVPYAAAMGGYERADTLEQFYRMATARTTPAFKSALARNGLSYFNLMWATSDGDIGYVQTGQAPHRPPGFNWEKMVPGWTSASLYKGEVPFAAHPAVENPTSGFLQNCNVAANVVTPGLTFTKEDFPPNVLYGHYDRYRARGARATELLTRVSQATLEDGRRIAFDTYVPPADLWVPVILEAYADFQKQRGATPGNDVDRQLEAAVRQLGTWNRQATRDSLGATLFRFWRLACNDMDSPVGRDRFQIPNTPQVRRDALKALRNAIQDLHTRFGTTRVPWGQIKRLRRGKRDWALSGDALGTLGMDTLRATTGTTFNADNQLIARGGQCVTSLVLLTSPPTIRSVVAYGQSNRPQSPHFADQAPLYSDERMRSVPWTMEQLKPHITAKTVFQHGP